MRKVPPRSRRVALVAIFRLLSPAPLAEFDGLVLRSSCPPVQRYRIAFSFFSSFVLNLAVSLWLDRNCHLRERVFTDSEVSYSMLNLLGIPLVLVFSVVLPSKPFPLRLEAFKVCSIDAPVGGFLSTSSLASSLFPLDAFRNLCRK